MGRLFTKKYVVSPSRKVQYGGKIRETVGFNTRGQAMNFIAKKKLKNALLYVRK
jgi:hypothetical protein